jgi:hypothetical protein
MTFTRTSDTTAEYTSQRGVRYRLWQSLESDSKAWAIAAYVTDLQPTYYAVPGVPGVLGFEVRRGLDGEVVGYAENLGDAAWPVEADLIKRGAQL